MITREELAEVLRQGPEELVLKIGALRHQVLTDLLIETEVSDKIYVRAIESGASHASAEREAAIGSRAQRFLRLRNQADLDTWLLAAELLRRKP